MQRLLSLLLPFVVLTYSSINNESENRDKWWGYWNEWSVSQGIILVQYLLMDETPTCVLILNHDFERCNKMALGQLINQYGDNFCIRYLDNVQLLHYSDSWKMFTRNIVRLSGKWTRATEVALGGMGKINRKGKGKVNRGHHSSNLLYL